MRLCFYTPTSLGFLPNPSPAPLLSHPVLHRPFPPPLPPSRLSDGSCGTLSVSFSDVPQGYVSAELLPALTAAVAISAACTSRLHVTPLSNSPSPFLPFLLPACCLHYLTRSSVWPVGIFTASVGPALWADVSSRFTLHLTGAQSLGSGHPCGTSVSWSICGWQASETRPQPSPSVPSSCHPDCLRVYLAACMFAHLPACHAIG